MTIIVIRKTQANPETYLETCLTFTIECFWKIANG